MILKLSPHLKVEPSPDHFPFTESISLYDGRKAMALAENWLKDCNYNHSAYSREKKMILPSRLLRIDDGQVRLYLSTDLKDGLNYKTLRYLARLSIERRSNYYLNYVILTSHKCDIITISNSLKFYLSPRP